MWPKFWATCTRARVTYFIALLRIQRESSRLFPTPEYLAARMDPWSPPGAMFPHLGEATSAFCPTEIPRLYSFLSRNHDSFHVTSKIRDPSRVGNGNRQDPRKFLGRCRAIRPSDNPTILMRFLKSPRPSALRPCDFILHLCTPRSHKNKKWLTFPRLRTRHDSRSSSRASKNDDYDYSKWKRPCQHESNSRYLRNCNNREFREILSKGRRENSTGLSRTVRRNKIIPSAERGFSWTAGFPENLILCLIAHVWIAHVALLILERLFLIYRAESKIRCGRRRKSPLFVLPIDGRGSSPNPKRKTLRDLYIWGFGRPISQVTATDINFK